MLKSSILIVLALSISQARAEEIKAFQAQEIQPIQAQEIQPYQASEIKPFHAESVQAGPQAALVQSNLKKNIAQRKLSDFFKKWDTVVPGAVYQTPSEIRGYDRLHVSAGAAGNSLRIFNDGRYQWGNTRGKWRKTEDAGYPIELIQAKDRRNWKVGWDTTPGPGGRIDILIWDGSTWYRGTPAKH